MYRGEISNRLSAITAIDYRILFDQKKEYSWLYKRVPSMEMRKGFEKKMTKILPWRPGARLWLELFEEKRLGLFSVGVPAIARALDMRVGSHIIDTFHFEDKYEFQKWIRITRSLNIVYTNDVALVGMNDIIKRHTGWTEEI